ncbi:MAG: DUF11 domain-containing protein [Blastocatellia bacterium]|nr:DUF11 domain-containing protein [Blastocatellia bacterium]
MLCVWPGVTAPGESRTLTVIVNVSAAAEDGATIVNSASTASLAFESDFSNNNDSVSVAVSANENIPQADVEISTSTIPETIDTGEQLVYTITVRNNGPDTAEDVLLRTSSPLGTRFVSLTTTQGTVTAPPAGGVGIAEVAIGDIEADNTVTVVLTVNVIGEGGDTVSVDVVIESSTNDPVAGNNSVAGSTGVLAGNDVLLTWDPPLPTVGDERNPPLHLQSQTVTTKSIAAALAAKVAGPRNTLVGYNIYRSNMPNTTPIPSNFFTSVGPGTTTVVAPTAPGGSFFVVTAQYPNGESGETNAASGRHPRARYRVVPDQGRQGGHQRYGVHRQRDRVHRRHPVQQGGQGEEGEHASSAEGQAADWSVGHRIPEPAGRGRPRERAELRHRDREVPVPAVMDS